MNEFMNYTIGEWLDIAAIKYEKNEAMVYVDRDIRMNYKELNNYCNRIAKGLIAMGIKKGDHVAIWAENYPEWLALIFATAKIGAVLVTINPNYKNGELQYLLEQSDTHTLFMGSGTKENDFIDVFSKLEITQLPRLKNVIFIPRNSNECIPYGFNSFENVVNFGKNISDEELEGKSKEVNCHDVTNIQYTSGTTGKPKGVELTHYNILNNAKFIGDNMHLTENDRYCISVPFFHCFGLVLSIMSCVTHGATMIPIDVFSPTKIFKIIEKERCTAINGAPAMFKMLLNHKDFKNVDFSSLRTGIMAGALCSEDIMKRVNEEMHIKDIVTVYGQTEASPGITMTTVDDILKTRVSTAGKPFPNVEVKLVDTDGNEILENYVEGEICARGYNIMKGYYNKPEETARVIKNGWLYTGDLAYRDVNGNYVIKGRKDDMIIRGGENIDPIEIENFLNKYPGINEAQVFGVESEIFGKEVAVCIIKEEGFYLDEQEVIEYVRKNMSKHKVPSYINFVNEFPKTAKGTIEKYKMRENIESQIQKYNSTKVKKLILKK